MCERTVIGHNADLYEEEPLTSTPPIFRYCHDSVRCQ